MAHQSLKMYNHKDLIFKYKDNIAMVRFYHGK